MNAQEFADQRAARQAAAPPAPCDWCRAVVVTAATAQAHQAECPEFLAWVLHPDEELLRDYWILVGDFHLLHLTQVLGGMIRIRDRARPGSPFFGPDYVHVGVAKRVRAGGFRLPGNATVAYHDMGLVNRVDGWIFNSLEGARVRALELVAHYEQMAATARAHVEGPPTVRAYSKALTAKRLPLPPGERRTTLVDTDSAAP